MTTSNKKTAATAPAADKTGSASASETTAREPGDEATEERKFAPDPFTIGSDSAAGVKLLEHRRFRRAEIEFADGKPSQAVIDKLKADGFRWNTQDKLWARPIGKEDALATRVEVERTYKDVVSLIREEKGLASPDRSSF